MYKKIVRLFFITLTFTHNALPAVSSPSTSPTKPYGEVRSNDPGVTKIHVAAANGDSRYLKQNLTSENVNAQDGTGSTPLHYALESGHIVCLAHLMLCKADVHIRNNDGATPLHFAAFGNNPIGFTVLLEAGANVNAVDNNGSTPLHILTTFETEEEKERKQELKCIRILLANGADILLTTASGKTALDLAQESKRDDMVALLQEHKIKKIHELEHETQKIEDQVKKLTLASEKVINKKKSALNAYKKL